MNINNYRIKIIPTFIMILIISLWIIQQAVACTTLMVGKKATIDGSVLMSSSCDGDVMGVISIMPAMQYPAGHKLPMYWNVPRPTNHSEYMANIRKGYDFVGYLPIEQTYRSIILGGNIESMTTGGLNELGLNIAIEFISMKPVLASPKGVVGPNSNHWTTSLIANGLMRTKTAREAIQLIGSMVEQYGFLYYRAPKAGVALPISDGNETWLMEIFGPGQNWNAASGKPGGVWCAQRIPDGEVGCSANRSRISQVNLKDKDHFMASPNLYSLAEEYDLWKKGEPFVWYEVYGNPGSNYNSLREWRALSLAAPSLDLPATGDPLIDRYPFSVKPDKSISVQTLMDIMRDDYQGTEFDITENPAFNPDGKKSPLARPWGPPELFDLLGVKPERSICTPTSGYVFVAQLRDWLPDSIGNCLWFAYGPAHTSCFTPIYAGVTDLPDSWDQPADFTKINRDQTQWNFRLTSSIANNLNYQDIIKDIQQVFEPAEENYFNLQNEFEKKAQTIFKKKGVAEAGKFVTGYAQNNLNQIGYAYKELVDYLMFQYLLDNSDIAPMRRPTIAAPQIP